ncbi:MAG: hypothetical protein ACTSW4_04640 [Candidatus Ranarchaeia archaeon]
MFPELRSRIEDLESLSKKTKQSKFHYFRVENTIFKMPENVTLLGVQKTQQLVKAIKEKAPSITNHKALQLSSESIQNRPDIPVNYQEEILAAIKAVSGLSDNTIDAIMESDEEIRKATIEDLVDL